MTATKLGIWMDHDHALLTEFTVDPMKTKTIVSEFTPEVKKESLSHGEHHLRTKKQHLQSDYFKKLAEAIGPYEEVVLFGPTSAKNELFNILNKDHHFAAIKIKLVEADKMTENQIHAFVRKHFQNR